MKRMYAVLAIVAVIVGLSVTQMFTVNRQINELSANVKKSYTSLNNGDFQKSYDVLANTVHNFTDSISWMRLFVDEGELEDISQSANMYLEYVMRRELPHAAAQYQSVLSSIDHANY